MWMMLESGTVAESEEQAKILFELISDQNPNGHLGWEIDYPTTSYQFIPFLGTPIRNSQEGRLEQKYYRKGQKKQITLNYRSHHPMRAKIKVAKKFYKTANTGSYFPELIESSLIRWLINY